MASTSIYAHTRSPSSRLNLIGCRHFAPQTAPRIAVRGCGSGSPLSGLFIGSSVGRRVALLAGRQDTLGDRADHGWQIGVWPRQLANESTFCLPRWLAVALHRA